MPRLLDDLYAFFQEHRRCGELDGGGVEGRVWMTCECGAGLARLILPFERAAQRADQEVA
jgi:hypothetical protein